MTNQQQFGGSWTEDKLLRIKGYLDAYMTIFRKYPFLQPIYVDAFAGTGRRSVQKKSSQPSAELELDLMKPTPAALEEVLKGSTRRALEVEPPFQRYIFIERSKRKCQELEAMVDADYPHRSRSVQIERNDASQFLIEWCRTTNWKNTRAVVFLDPFGMQIEWTLLETIAKTQAIDLWLLVPIGMGVNRLMTRNNMPPEEWAKKLTLFFGNDEWKNRFYGPPLQLNFDDDDSTLQKTGNFQALADYFISRLKEIFPGVADNPLTQYNSQNSPMFLLCFATANPNPKTRDAALNIAKHLLKER